MGERKFVIKLEVMPNIALPLAYLCELGGANKGSARAYVCMGQITTFKGETDQNMISVDEMKRLEKIGMIRIEK